MTAGTTTLWSMPAKAVACAPRAICQRCGGGGATAGPCLFAPAGAPAGAPRAKAHALIHATRRDCTDSVVAHLLAVQCAKPAIQQSKGGAGGPGRPAHWHNGFHPPLWLQPKRACALPCVSVVDGVFEEVVDWYWTSRKRVYAPDSLRCREANDGAAIACLTRSPFHRPHFCPLIDQGRCNLWVTLCEGAGAALSQAGSHEDTHALALQARFIHTFMLQN